MPAPDNSVMRERWIHSPGFDLIVGCGAWSLPLLLLAYPFAGGGLPTWTAIFYALALVFNYPHYMATVYRAYHTKGDFDRYRIYTKTITGLLLLTLVIAHWSYRLVPWLFTIYITWSPWHYMGQNFGLSMMFIRRNGIAIDVKDRNALWTAFVASYLMIFLSFHTNPSSDPYVLSLNLPTLIDLFRIPLLFIFLILGIWPLGKLVRKAGWRPMLAPIVLLTTEFLWFVLPTVIELVSNIRVPQTRYSAGILAVMHSAQYIWITSYYARQEAETSRRMQWRPVAYFAVLALGGVALFVPVPWLASWVFRRDFTSSFLIVTALVNIHHFILDGAVWKLRESRVASLLIPEGTKGPSHIKPWAWPVWVNRRALQVAFVAVLVILAGLDQVRYFLTIPGRSSSDIALAASLNPYDALTQQRVGRAYAFAGDYAGAERALQNAVRWNPGLASAHMYLGNILELQGDGGRALPHYEHCEQAARAAGNSEMEQSCSQKIRELRR